MVPGFRTAMLPPPPPLFPVCPCGQESLVPRRHPTPAAPIWNREIFTTGSVSQTLCAYFQFKLGLPVVTFLSVGSGQGLHGNFVLWVLVVVNCTFISREIETFMKFFHK